MFFKPDLVGISTLHPRKEFHHWSSRSEVYASGSHLMSAVLRGWQVNMTVIRKLQFFGGGRQTSVYYFELLRDGNYMTMPVVESPTVIRLLMMNPFELVGYQEMTIRQKTTSFPEDNGDIASVV